jgi:hypothetical protein
MTLPSGGGAVHCLAGGSYRVGFLSGLAWRPDNVGYNASICVYQAVIALRRSLTINFVSSLSGIRL